MSEALGRDTQADKIKHLSLGHEQHLLPAA